MQHRLKSRGQQPAPDSTRSQNVDVDETLSRDSRSVSEIFPPEITVVVPVFNESDSILPLIEEIRVNLDGRVRYEILYVDDGSTDDTFERLQQAQARYDNLLVVRHETNAGQSTAIRTGVERAAAAWIVTMDGDGQNDPADILRLLELRDDKTDTHPQLITGVRVVRHDTWLRCWSSRIANTVRAALLRDGIADTGCSLKLFPRDAFLSLPLFDHMHRFLPALIQRSGGTIKTIDVCHRPRLAGNSKYGIRNRLWPSIIDLFGVMWLQRRIKQPSTTEHGNRKWMRG